MLQPKHLIFDLDGTLIHSAPDIQAALNDALLSVERPVLSLETVISFIGNGVETLVTRSLHATGGMTDTLQAKTLACFLERYDKDPSSRTHPYPGAVDCLKKFQTMGLKLGICTNKPSIVAQEICTALEIAHFFEVIEGAVPEVPKKPNPEPLERVMAALGGSTKDTIYVGDSTVDQATAQNAGLPFVLFEGGYLNADLSGPPPISTFNSWGVDWYSALGD